MKKPVSTLFNRVVYYTIKCPEAAKNLADKLITKPNDSIILPFIDHPGPMSQELLSRRFGSLTFCDRDEERGNIFKEHVSQNFPDRNIRIYKEDLFDLSHTIAYSPEAQRICSDIVKGSLEHSSDKNREIDVDDTINNNNNNIACDRPQVKFLVPLLQSKYEAGFLRNVYYQISLKVGLCANTLLNYYFLMSDRQFNYFNAKPGGNLTLYRSTAILYNTIFNIHNLDSLELDSSFGIPLRKIQKTSKINDNSYRQVHIVWLEPNLDVLTNLDSRALLEYRFFINQIMIKRTGLVTKFIAQWFGKFNGDMIKFGITDKTRTGDLTRDQYYNLFLYLRSKREYKKSTFLQAAERAEDHILST